MKHQEIFNLIHEKNIYEGFDLLNENIKIFGDNYNLNLDDYGVQRGLETFCSEFGKTYDTSNESWPQWIINNENIIYN